MIKGDTRSVDYSSMVVSSALNEQGSRYEGLLDQETHTESRGPWELCAERRWRKRRKHQKSQLEWDLL